MTNGLTVFAQYLSKQKKLSVNTIQSYVKDLENFFQFLSTDSLSHPSQATAQQIHQYIEYLEGKGRSSSTIARNMASIRCYYQYLCQEDGAYTNPAQGIKRKKVEQKCPTILTGDELDNLFAQPDTREPKGCRDKAMMELLYATGIRVSELIALNVGDINLQDGILTCGGLKSTRRVPVYPAAVTAVTDYLFRVRGSILKEDAQVGQALFVNLNGRRLSRQGFWKIIKGYASQARIATEITPYTLRHSFAMHLLENGAQLRDIQAMLGHMDISSTQRYAHILDRSYEEAYFSHHPKAKKG